ncbi:MAG: UDP-4-amino-4,6-dideoxy-N-acetyl-beta-L-altrosamine transaminase [Sphingomonadaceae bacterium]|nr:UDP-4-amino-4,6-dideoxy-N-acetyl-beta-L-altrosamine transaminase [Sphingomonadaceae bacterium]
MDVVPYSRQSIDDADVAAVVETLRSDFLTQGPAVPRFEAAFVARHEIAHGVAVANATAGLHISCLALGLGPGDRLWTSPNSFVASANCAIYCGAEVDFVDIDPETRNMSVEALAAKLERAQREDRLPKIVVPVDFAGLPCDLEAMRELADRYGFAILEDASHAVGARFRGAPVGSRYADITVFSFHPVKIVTTGEGGLCATHSEALAERLRLLRSHGITRDPAAMSGPSDGPWYYEQVGIGFNYRLTDLQAALGSSQLQRLETMHAAREQRTRRYDDGLAALPLRLPARFDDRQSAHHLYVVEIDEARSDVSRAALFARLRADGIGANVHYIPIHLQPFYRGLGFGPGDFPHAEQYYRRAVTIPLFPAMTDAEQDRVVESLGRALS